MITPKRRDPSCGKIQELRLASAKLLENLERDGCARVARGKSRKIVPGAFPAQ